MTLKKVSKVGDSWVVTDLRDGSTIKFLTPGWTRGRYPNLGKGERWPVDLDKVWVPLSCRPRGRSSRWERARGCPFTVKALLKAKSQYELQGICTRPSLADQHAAMIAKSREMDKQLNA